MLSFWLQSMIKWFAIIAVFVTSVRCSLFTHTLISSRDALQVCSCIICDLFWKCVFCRWFNLLFFSSKSSFSAWILCCFFACTVFAQYYLFIHVSSRVFMFSAYSLVLLFFLCAVFIFRHFAAVAVAVDAAAPIVVDAFHCSLLGSGFFCFLHFFSHWCVYLWFFVFRQTYGLCFSFFTVALFFVSWFFFHFLFHNRKILLRTIELLRGIVRLNPIGEYVSTVKHHAFAGAIFIFPVWMMGSQVGASIAYTLNWRWRVLLMW